MASNIKIGDRTGTEQIYNSVPYIKVKDTNNTDQIFINTSDADISASDVTVGKTAYGSSGQLINGAYESSGGVSINGIINAYKVDAGQNINAGDFVAFVNKMLSYENSSYTVPSAILLEPNKVFIAHSYGSNRYLYGTIVTIDGTTMTPTTTQLSTVSNSCVVEPSAILLEPNKVFIAHSYSGSLYLYGTIVTIDGTTMTPVTTQLSTVSNSCYREPSAILLEANKIFIAHSYSTSYYLYGTIVTINGTTMTSTTTQLSTVSNSCVVEPSAILLEPNKVFIAHSYSGSLYLYGTIVTINGDMMTANTQQLSTVTNSCYQSPSAILLSENKVFIAHPYSDSRYLYGTIVTIDGTTMTPTTTQLSTVTNSCYYAPSAVLLSENKVFIAHPYNNSYYLSGVITNINNTTLTPTIPIIDVVAQVNTSSPKGIAAQSGVSGDTINCYTPV